MIGVPAQRTLILVSTGYCTSLSDLLRGHGVGIALINSQACFAIRRSPRPTSTVSKKISATLARSMCSSFLATSVKRTRDAIPGPAHNEAVRRRCSSPAGGKRKSHKMLFGTRCRMRSHAAKMDWNATLTWERMKSVNISDHLQDQAAYTAWFDQLSRP